jgi:hypothetical protein
MSKRHIEGQEDSLPIPERESIWDLIVDEWLTVRNIPEAAERLRRELDRMGIHSPDELVKAPVGTLRAAVFAALQVDAQALAAAALRVLQKESKT